MRARSCPLLIPLLVAVLVPLAPRADDAPPAVDPAVVPSSVEAPPPAAPTSLSHLEERLESYRSIWRDADWRIGAAAGWINASVDVRYRTGLRSGFGIALFGGVQPRRLDREYALAGFALEWWRERTHSLLPGVVGWTLAAGPVGTEFAFIRKGERYGVAYGGGVIAAYTVHANLPLLHLLFDLPPSRAIPSVLWEIGMWGGWVGPMENVDDWDVDGDGVIDHRDGERFVNPDGRSAPAAIGGFLFRSGVNWVF